jgi:PKD repeat protein
MDEKAGFTLFSLAGLGLLLLARPKTAPTLPSAAFSASPLSGPAPLSVVFTNQSTGATGYSWDFGDGTPPEASVSPVHTYAAPGTYVAVLTATNGGQSSQATATITVEGGGPPPVGNVNFVAASTLPAEQVEIWLDWVFLGFTSGAGLLLSVTPGPHPFFFAQYDPTHPATDASGMIRTPAITLAVPSSGTITVTGDMFALTVSVS